MTNLFTLSTLSTPFSINEVKKGVDEVTISVDELNKKVTMVTISVDNVDKNKERGKN